MRSFIYIDTQMSTEQTIDERTNNQTEMQTIENIRALSVKHTT